MKMAPFCLRLAFSTALFLFWVEAKPKPDKEVPAYLFSGQSNMIGHPHEAGELYAIQKNFTEWGLSLESLLDIFSLKKGEDKLKPLVSEINKVDFDIYEERPDRYPNGTSMVEATLLLELDQNYSLKKLAKPIDSHCSFLLLGREDVTEYPYVEEFQDYQKIGPRSFCGLPWGPELMFGHLLPKSVVAKVASGGSQLHLDWRMEEAGTFWKLLNDTIHQSHSNPSHMPCGKNQCDWKAFVWSQGESDSFHYENALGYAGNLTLFIQHVRHEIFLVSKFERPEDVPVVVVQLGDWLYSSDYGQIITEAQDQFCLQDDKAECVTTNDLTPYYHFEAAAFLIIGSRIANAIQRLEATE